MEVTSVTYTIPKAWLYRVTRLIFSGFVFIFFRTYIRLKIKGASNIPLGPFIICSNHQSHLDALILSYLGSFDFSRTAMIAAKDYWYDHRKRFLISNLFFNVIPLSRSDTAKSFSIRQVAGITKDFLGSRGKGVVILPEGTRSTNGEVKSFKNGILILSKLTGLPVLPVFIHGSKKSWPKGTFFVKPGRVRVNVGTLLSAAYLSTQPDASAIREKVLELGEEIHKR